MTIHSGPWLSKDPQAQNLQLVQLQVAAIQALADGDLDSARRLTHVTLTPYLISAECRGTWQRRSTQITESPGDAPWVTRLIVDPATNLALGRAGYHGPPDDAGMVEIGYSVDPGLRRKGHARAALVILLDAARSQPEISIVRATVSPDNTPSRRLVDQYGFVETGEQWDEEDGLETILELNIRS
ncbi:GNAT family N-acetyltransferase [Micrococcaceae bacterium Sec5.7]